MGNSLTFSCFATLSNQQSIMAPRTILIVGATGNTGRKTTETLSQNTKTMSHLKEYRLLALTRSTGSAVAQTFSRLSNVTLEEKNWPEIDAAWLRERNVVKVFIASHNEPAHFAEESAFHVAALKAARAQGRVLLVHHHVARARHVLLLQTLDVHADVVTRARRVLALVVHLHREHLAAARVRRGVRRQEDDLLTRLHRALLDTPGDHVTDALDLVDAGHRQAHGRLARAHRRAGQIIEDLEKRVEVELLRARLLILHLNVTAVPPRHVRRPH